MSHALERSRLSRLATSVASWTFGVSTSLLLVGVWGGAVTADRATLDDSARLVLASGLVQDRVEAWLQTGLGDMAAIPPSSVEAAVQDIMDAPETGVAIDQLVDQAVAAALAPAGSQATLEIGPPLTTMRPAIARALAGAGLEAPESLVASVTEAELSAPAQSMPVGAVRDAGRTLTVVMVVGMFGMTLTAAVMLWLDDDRRERLRSLASRVAISGLTFALMLRVGAWAVDPDGGRSSIRGAASLMLSSNGHVPLLIAGTAALAALAVRLRRRRVLEPTPAVAEEAVSR